MIAFRLNRKIERNAARPSRRHRTRRALRFRQALHRTNRGAATVPQIDMLPDRLVAMILRRMSIRLMQIRLRMLIRRLAPSRAITPVMAATVTGSRFI
jgi:hypothetical protein